MKYVRRSLDNVEAMQISPDSSSEDVTAFLGDLAVLKAVHGSTGNVRLVVIEVKRGIYTEVKAGDYLVKDGFGILDFKREDFERLYREAE